MSDDDLNVAIQKIAMWPQLHLKNSCWSCVIQLQWGSEIRSFKIWKQIKSRLFEGQFSNDPVFKWLSLSYGYNSKTRRFNPDFKWLMTKWQPFVRISKGWAPDCRSHSKSIQIQTSPYFRSSQYLRMAVTQFKLPMYTEFKSSSFLYKRFTDIYSV